MAATAAAAVSVVIVVVIFDLFVEIICAQSQIIRHQRPVFKKDFIA
jgi:hypothetical protein